MIKQIGSLHNKCLLLVALFYLIQHIRQPHYLSALGLIVTLLAVFITHPLVILIAAIPDFRILALVGVLKQGHPWLVSAMIVISTVLNMNYEGALYLIMFLFLRRQVKLSKTKQKRIKEKNSKVEIWLNSIPHPIFLINSALKFSYLNAYASSYFKKKGTGLESLSSVLNSQTTDLLLAKIKLIIQKNKDERVLLQFEDELVQLWIDPSKAFSNQTLLLCTFISSNDNKFKLNLIRLIQRSLDDLRTKVICSKVSMHRLIKTLINIQLLNVYSSLPQLLKKKTPNLKLIQIEDQEVINIRHIILWQCDFFALINLVNQHIHISVQFSNDFPHTIKGSLDELSRFFFSMLYFLLKNEGPPVQSIKILCSYLQEPLKIKIQISINRMIAEYECISIQDIHNFKPAKICYLSFKMQVQELGGVFISRKAQKFKLAVQLPVRMSLENEPQKWEGFCGSCGHMQNFVELIRRQPRQMQLDNQDLLEPQIQNQFERNKKYFLEGVKKVISKFRKN